MYVVQLRMFEYSIAIRCVELEILDPVLSTLALRTGDVRSIIVGVGRNRFVALNVWYSLKRHELAVFARILLVLMLRSLYTPLPKSSVISWVVLFVEVVWVVLLKSNYGHIIQLLFFTCFGAVSSSPSVFFSFCRCHCSPLRVGLLLPSIWWCPTFTPRTLDHVAGVWLWAYCAAAIFHLFWCSVLIAFCGVLVCRCRCSPLRVGLLLPSIWWCWFGLVYGSLCLVFSLGSALGNRSGGYLQVFLVHSRVVNTMCLHVHCGIFSGCLCIKP